MQFSFLLEDLRHHVSLSKIDRITTTCELGLLKSLALMIVFARSLGLILKCEMMSIHRLRMHIFSFHRPSSLEARFRDENFAHISLLASMKHSFSGGKYRFCNTYSSVDGVRCSG